MDDDDNVTSTHPHTDNNKRRKYEKKNMRKWDWTGDLKAVHHHTHKSPRQLGLHFFAHRDLTRESQAGANGEWNSVPGHTGGRKFLVSGNDVSSFLPNTKHSGCASDCTASPRTQPTSWQTECLKCLNNPALAFFHKNRYDCTDPIYS